MEFLDPKQKRAQTVKLYIGYLLMTVLIVMATIMLSLFSFGFNFDAKTGSVIQNGLVFVDAHPESARVSIDNSDKGSTDVRLVLPAGKHSVKLSREGYRDWSHDLTLDGGGIERFAYPFLFPQKLVPKDAQLFASRPTLATQSPDRRWLVVKHAEKLNDFEIVDLNAQNIESTIITLEATTLHQEGTSHTFEAIEWSTDNRHVLIKHTFEGGDEFLVIDRQSSSNSININAQFKRPLSSVMLRDKKFDRYYIHDKTSGDLVAATLNSQEITSVASKVVAFQPHGADIVLYVSDESTTSETVTVKIKNGDKRFTLRTIPKSPRYLLNLAQFTGKWYVAAGSSNEKKVYIYRDPFSGLKHENNNPPTASVLLQLTKTIEFLSFSANARFIAVQSGSNFAVFDAENVRQFRYDSKLTLTPLQEVKWMDGHRLAVVSDNQVKVFDFDGTNSQTLIAADAGFYPFFDRDYTVLYTISPSITVKNKDSIVRTSMKYDPNPAN